MKATPTANSSSRVVERTEGAVRPLDPDKDALVMVLFPLAVWAAVCALAADLGVEPSEALGAALALLREKADAMKGGG